MNRLYTNGFGKLAVGRARYGIMLRKDGSVMDDGTTSRLTENHYYMTTTAAAAGAVMSHMEYYHQAIWPDLKVQFASVTDQWSAFAVAGLSLARCWRRLLRVSTSARRFPIHGGV